MAVFCSGLILAGICRILDLAYDEPISPCFSNASANFVRSSLIIASDENPLLTLNQLAFYVSDCYLGFGAFIVCE